MRNFLYGSNNLFSNSFNNMQKHNKNKIIKWTFNICKEYVDLDIVINITCY